MTDQCPNCGSRSGVDVYNRGFCHACKKDFNTKSIIKKERPHERLELPQRTDYITKQEGEYLNRYEIDMLGVLCFHSEEYNRLCFPYPNSGIMKGCWMRDLTGLSRAKWLFAGTRDFVWAYVTKERNETCVVVEDVISAIKLSRYTDVVCLGGTSFSYPLLVPHFLKHGYQKLIAFFDGDKAGKTAAQKFRLRFKGLVDVDIIRTTKDPKEYTHEQLGEMLR